MELPIKAPHLLGDDILEIGEEGCSDAVVKEAPEGKSLEAGDFGSLQEDRPSSSPSSCSHIIGNLRKSCA